MLSITLGRQGSKLQPPLRGTSITSATSRQRLETPRDWSHVRSGHMIKGRSVRTVAHDTKRPYAIWRGDGVRSAGVSCSLAAVADLSLKANVRRGLRAPAHCPGRGCPARAGSARTAYTPFVSLFRYVLTHFRTSGLFVDIPQSYVSVKHCMSAAYTGHRHDSIQFRQPSKRFPFSACLQCVSALPLEIGDCRTIFRTAATKFGTIHSISTVIWKR